MLLAQATLLPQLLLLPRRRCCCCPAAVAAAVASSSSKTARRRWAAPFWRFMLLSAEKAESPLGNLCAWYS